MYSQPSNQMELRIKIKEHNSRMNLCSLNIDDTRKDGTYSIHGKRGSSPSYSSIASINFLHPWNQSVRTTQVRQNEFKEKKDEEGPSGIQERSLELIFWVIFEDLIQEANIAASFQGSYIFFEQFPLVTRLLFWCEKLRLWIHSSLSSSSWILRERLQLWLWLE
jgi:hypothetical protein